MAQQSNPLLRSIELFGTNEVEEDLNDINTTRDFKGNPTFLNQKQDNKKEDVKIYNIDELPDSCKMWFGLQKQSSLLRKDSKRIQAEKDVLKPTIMDFLRREEHKNGIHIRFVDEIDQTLFGPSGLWSLQEPRPKAFKTRQFITKEELLTYLPSLLPLTTSPYDLIQMLWSKLETDLLKQLTKENERLPLQIKYAKRIKRDAPFVQTQTTTTMSRTKKKKTMNDS
jgi:hypothetical protein